MLRKARNDQKGNCNTILERWYKDDKYRKSLSDIGWTEEQIKQYDAIALEDHSYVAANEERRRNISLNREGLQGPMIQRSDFKEAMHKCKRLYDEYTERTGEGNKPIPPAQQMRQRREQQFEGLDEYNYTVDPRTGWRFSPFI